jgi:hypothetical protein
MDGWCKFEAYCDSVNRPKNCGRKKQKQTYYQPTEQTSIYVQHISTHVYILYIINKQDKKQTPKIYDFFFNLLWCWYEYLNIYMIDTSYSYVLHCCCLHNYMFLELFFVVYCWFFIFLATFLFQFCSILFNFSRSYKFVHVDNWPTVSFYIYIFIYSVCFCCFRSLLNFLFH